MAILTTSCQSVVKTDETSGVFSTSGKGKICFIFAKNILLKHEKVISYFVNVQFSKTLD